MQSLFFWLDPKEAKDQGLAKAAAHGYKMEPAH